MLTRLRSALGARRGGEPRTFLPLPNALQRRAEAARVAAAAAAGAGDDAAEPLRSELLLADTSDLLHTSSLVLGIVCDECAACCLTTASPHGEYFTSAGERLPAVQYFESVFADAAKDIAELAATPGGLPTDTAARCGKSYRRCLRVLIHVLHAHAATPGGLTACGAMDVVSDAAASALKVASARALVSEAELAPLRSLLAAGK
jgi:hypothetical protein